MKLKFLFTLCLLLSIISNLRSQWETQYFDNQQVPGLTNKIKFKNDSIGLLMGSHKREGEESTYNALKTTNGGETWYKVDLGMKVNVKDFQFISDSMVYAVGQYFDDSEGSKGIFIKSYDLGETWDSIFLLPLQIDLSLSFMDSDTGILAYYNYIFRTTNGGMSWDTTWYARDAGFGFSFFEDVSLIGSVGYVTGNIASGEIGGVLLKSENYGRTWDTLKTFNQWPKTMHFLNADTGFLSAQFGPSNLQKTTDGGQTWQDISPIATANSIHFPSNQIGYAVGRANGRTHNASSGFFISKTTDGGSTWETYDTAGMPLQSVHFINDSTGYVSGENRLIMKKSGDFNRIGKDYPWSFIVFYSVEDHETGKPQSKIYPNPTTGVLNIEPADANKVKSIQLISYDGAVIQRVESIARNPLTQFDMNYLASGMYFIQITYENRRETLKVLKH